MKTHSPYFAATLGAALLLSTAAFAQGRIVGTEAIDDEITDIEREAQDEFDNAADAGRFGFAAYPQGFSGNISAAGSASDGNSENKEVSIGGRIRYGQGANNYSFGIVYEYGEDEDDRNENNLFVSGDYNRYVTEQFYVFGLGRYEYDEFGPLEHDAFIGVGPGYRIIKS